MSKCIVIGEQNAQRKQKPIEFQRCVDAELRVCDSGDFHPSDMDYIELICKNYVQGVDIMFAYSRPDKRHEGLLVFGKWNDGVV